MSYIKGFTPLLLTFLLGFSNLGFAQVISPSEVDSSYESYVNEAWDKIRNASDQEADSLQEIFSDKFYNYYLDPQKTQIGSKAFEYAFVMWGNIGKFKYVNEALETLDNDSPLWGKNYISIGKNLF